ncbi:hypothetical protein PO878_15335 [Iamia majanohamensis]|uniref:N-acetyltransferase domain-containing protein n=1 Tax=Iamia majanohamensis TaxID=467976 RepID=A0AAF0BUK8_9ACTN|nr:hypothetical protein [Iamia majanohamensis]WCO65875.1 hypothetical protein PO878_15335 [Iamia majanohamensis]
MPAAPAPPTTAGPADEAGVEHEALADLARTARFGPLRAYEHDHPGITGPDAERRLRAALDDDDATVVVARRGDEVVGVVSVASSPWETENLGVRVARVGAPVVGPAVEDAEGVATALYAAVLQHWAEGLVIGRVDVGDTAALVGAQQAGLRALETRITYLGDHDAPPDHHHRHRGFEVRRHDGPEVADIPRPALEPLRRWVAGTDRPGHFYSDPRLSPDRVASLYLSWLDRAFSGAWGDVAYTAWREDQVVGFLSWLRTPDLEEAFGLRTLVAGLGAAAAPEGRGSLGDMYEAVCTDRPLGTRFVEHTSQAGNAAVLTTWSRFHAIRPGMAEYVLHGWVGG